MIFLAFLLQNSHAADQEIVRTGVFAATAMYAGYQFKENMDLRERNKSLRLASVNKEMETYWSWQKGDNRYKSLEQEKQELQRTPTFCEALLACLCPQ